MQPSCKNPSQCLALTCYGQFFQTVIAGWDDHECVRAFDFIGQATSVLKRLNNIVNYKPGKESVLRALVYIPQVFYVVCSDARTAILTINMQSYWGKGLTY